MHIVHFLIFSQVKDTTSQTREDCFSDIVIAKNFLDHYVFVAFLNRILQNKIRSNHLSWKKSSIQILDKDLKNASFNQGVVNWRCSLWSRSKVAPSIEGTINWPHLCLVAQFLTAPLLKILKSPSIKGREVDFYSTFCAYKNEAKRESQTH